MTEWKTLKQETLDVGSNNFIEINVKQPPESEKYLIGISKGWYTQDGEKRYKNNILFSQEKKQELIDIIANIDEGLE